MTGTVFGSFVPLKRSSHCEGSCQKSQLYKGEESTFGRAHEKIVHLLNKDENIE